jgi:hypothetical protein
MESWVKNMSFSLSAIGITSRIILTDNGAIFKFRFFFCTSAKAFYIIVEIRGCRTPFWFGEGDARIYIDGNTKPSRSANPFVLKKTVR